MATSYSAAGLMSPARTSRSPSTSRNSRPGWSELDFSRMPLTFNRNSVTSSVTWLMVEYSCWIPWIFTQVMAALSIELRSTLRIELPMVVPSPLSRGSTLNRP